MADDERAQGPVLLLGAQPSEDAAVPTAVLAPRPWVSLRFTAPPLLAFADSKFITSRARCSPGLLAAVASAVMLTLPVTSEMQMSLQAP